MYFLDNITRTQWDISYLTFIASWTKDMFEASSDVLMSSEMFAFSSIENVEIEAVYKGEKK